VAAGQGSLARGRRSGVPRPTWTRGGGRDEAREGREAGEADGARRSGPTA
jgi:hypothetical protein